MHNFQWTCIYICSTKKTSPNLLLTKNPPTFNHPPNVWAFWGVLVLFPPKKVVFFLLKNPSHPTTQSEELRQLRFSQIHHQMFWNTCGPVAVWRFLFEHFRCGVFVGILKKTWSQNMGGLVQLELWGKQQYQLASRSTGIKELHWDAWPSQQFSYLIWCDLLGTGNRIRFLPGFFMNQFSKRVMR